jgi:hypothetical protein
VIGGWWLAPYRRFENARKTSVAMQTERNARTAKRRARVAVPRNSELHSESSGGIESSPRWTFLTNHSHVLILLGNEPSLILREVAVRVGITERAVQRIIAELEEDGFLEREKIGRQNHYRILAETPLRHPIEAHRSIGDLLALINDGENRSK